MTHILQRRNNDVRGPQTNIWNEARIKPV